MIDFAGLANYVSWSKDQGNKFLKEFADMPCMPSIEALGNSWMLVRYYFPQGTVKMVLGVTL